MMHLEFKHDNISKSGISPIENSRENGGAGRKCGRGKYKLQSSTKAGLILQIAQRSEREEDE
jgi:hypothetical protein